MKSRKILVAVTGMSPQIVTETLYALVVHHQWVPDEVHVLTTALGRDRLVESLLTHGYLRRFCDEYGVADIAFSSDFIHLISDAQGQPLTDIRTPEQNNLAADMIVRFIYDLCMRDDVELHVSIAGGRKSMGFYIGYALSLFGRRQDRLSHVLVNEPFESLPDFFFPTREDCWVESRAGKVNAKLADVMLADIPFVRMRDGMPKLDLNEGWNYLQAVEQTQKHMAEWRLEIDPNQRTLRCGNAKPIHLSPQQFALYAAMAELKAGNKLIHKESSEDIALLLEVYLRHYDSIVDLAWREDPDGFAESLCKDDYAEMKRILQENASVIYRKLRSELNKYADFFRIASTGGNNCKQYFLVTDKNQIVWLDKV